MPHDPIQDFVHPFRWRQELRARLVKLQADVDAMQSALLVQQATINRMSTMVDNVLLVAQETLTVAQEIFEVVTKPPPTPVPPTLHFNWALGPITAKKESTMLEITLTNEQKVSVTATPVTATGKPAPIDGQVEFTVQAGDGSVARIDDKSAFLLSGDNPGDTTVLVSVDADLGAGVETVSDIVTLHVEGARAASLGLVAGTPEAK